MAEVAGTLVQVLAPITGADQQIGVGQTYPHPTGAKPLTDRWVKRICIQNPITNAGNASVSVKASAGTSKMTLTPGMSREWIAYNPGERWRLGWFYVTTTGSETVEVDYTL
jgi:hypothetical protein